ncbi:leucine-rich repeat-containing protein 4B-like [Metopolophium dirhodum]|uniref:leucine-rich repeat-containing protein 4B-like n=1 Tax=Metopolophium dirhodum TaxID=44670 RepID=UPI00298FB0CA|nr:leucine-rich repeat-containing protein 4B-like [Metopolophium dirhodum]XP_060877531.1 leucine-rich repeat-containing protein 4B-like [Metopolophium dirhodum]XP_060877532.1 leucine-rich repeat-containing protein 4B-like [Metopolophium dirhodum]XP_060877533.1 leucine-rich repeat-containing protein 4B-like [Metopolophium dirhodum]
MYATDTVPRRRVAQTTATTTTTMIFVAAVMATVLATAAGCPIGCMCKWKGGKQTVECVNRSLSAIPNGMDVGTQVLDMSGNSMDALSRGRFMSAGLSNLQKIFMARCRITYVDDAAFQGLSNLVELDLSDNGITDIPTKSFDDYPQLMKLVLSGNAVTVVRTAAFKRLAYLTVLDLSRCRVSTIEPGAFDGLHSIEWLRLDHNQIVRIESAGAVVLPLSLHGIEMHHNPWTCDCRLRDVHQWLNNNSAPHTVEPTCHGPDRLRGMVIRKLDAEELACAPVAAAASPEYVETDAGKNVTLACRVTPAGQARVSWWFEGRQVANSTTSAGVELTVEDVGPADNGTYACVAENRAGWAACNFTVRVIQEPSEVAAGSYPPDQPPPALLVIVLAGSVCFVAVAVVCAVSCRLLVAKRRRRRDHAGRPGGKSGGAGGGDAGADDPSNSGQGAKTTSDIRQSDSVNLTVSSTVDGKLSSAEDVSVYGEYDAAAGPGSSAGYEVHEVMHVGGGGGYDAYQQVHVAQGHPATTTATTTLEANPDLISDASTVIRDNGGGDYRDATDEVYKITVPPPPSCGRDFWSTSGAVYPSGGGCGSYELQLSPGKLTAGEPYPADYGLPKLSSGQYPMPAPPSLYRTLPHRRNAAKPQGRSCQEAEFVLLQQHHHHHHHHHQQQQQQQHQHHLNRYEPQNIRYNQQGYPYPASAVAADAAYYATAAATFYEPPSLSNASAQTLDDETMVMMMMMPPAPPPPPLVTGASALPTAGRQPQHLSAEHAASQHKAVTAVQKQPATTESPDEGYVGEGPDS